MSRSKRDILNTEAMLERLTQLLAQYHNWAGNSGVTCAARADAESLRRISMTLHRWHELECGDGNDHGSWCISRGRKDAGGAFEYDDAGKPYMEYHSNTANGARYSLLIDRERGALKRLKTIMARYPALQAYVQTDPRGCALYILRPGDAPAGADVSSYYSRGLAVFQ